MASQLLLEYSIGFCNLWPARAAPPNKAQIPQRLTAGSGDTNQLCHLASVGKRFCYHDLPYQSQGCKRQEKACCISAQASRLELMHHAVVEVPVFNLVELRVCVVVLGCLLVGSSCCQICKLVCEK